MNYKKTNMDTINLNELKIKAHDNAKNKGFWDKEHNGEHLFMLVICELAGSIEADRIGKRADVYFFKEELRGTKNFNPAFEFFIKDTVEDKLADAVIRLLDIAGRHDFDLKHVEIDRYTDDLSKELTADIFSIIGSFYIIEDEKDLNEAFYLFISLIFSVAKTLNTDLIWHIKQKMKYNKSRPHKHGKAY